MSAALVYRYISECYIKAMHICILYFHDMLCTVTTAFFSIGDRPLEKTKATTKWRFGAISIVIFFLSLKADNKCANDFDGLPSHAQPLLR